MSDGQRAGIDADQVKHGQNPGAWLWNKPAGASKATLILAHGAGAPMDSDFMTAIAELLAQRGVAVVRFEFAYMAARRLDGKRRPPSPQARLLEQWREVYARVRQQVDGPLAIGGKSMGGRMASLLADELAADALVCLGYPFHAIGKADKPRVAHLAELRTPTLIVQGERDPMGDAQTVAAYRLAEAVRIHWLAAADHDLKPLKRSGFTHGQHLQAAADAVASQLMHRGTGRG
ncbi:alpha/beta family hydrolase [Pseudomonas benzenivorans]|uniref:Dienelactone hydrolase family protein n=1 Tax=Pseudomonas benzenivorans TaxID=556533 RepID=A0ABY5H6H0_9PSED|nr:alpha/beta family hydrolase [Pseudomonas benzenivorans]UTW07718.1 dienelactone hydrolase family protein [Pseudomonas benzenivorans]